MFENSTGGKILRLESVWDSESEASEFFEAYAKLVPVKFKGIKKLNPNAKLIGSEEKLSWKNGQQLVMMQRLDNRVVIVETIDSDTPM
jgi:hypothetical protein